jgi:hypothetical protein
MLNAAHVMYASIIGCEKQQVAAGAKFATIDPYLLGE